MVVRWCLTEWHAFKSSTHTSRPWNKALFVSSFNFSLPYLFKSLSSWIKERHSITVKKAAFCSQIIHFVKPSYELIFTPLSIKRRKKSLFGSTIAIFPAQPLIFYTQVNRVPISFTQRSETRLNEPVTSLLIFYSFGFLLKLKSNMNSWSHHLKCKKTTP